MSVIINYTKSQYLAKITELQGYYDMLAAHLDKLKGLKDQVVEFWQDDSSEKTLQLLQITINDVERSMQRTNEMLIFYRTTVEKMDASGSFADGSFEKLFGLVGLLK